MKQKYFKPDYCIDKDLDCEKCENYVKEDENCLLTKDHIKILDDKREIKRK